MFKNIIFAFYMFSILYLFFYIKTNKSLENNECYYQRNYLDYDINCD